MCDIDEVRFIKVHEDAKLPSKQSKGASGYDLYAVSDGVVSPVGAATFSTGLRLSSCPSNIDIQIRSRSGLASKGVVVANSPGTIDTDYRGELMVLLINLSHKPYKIRKGDRVAQMVFGHLAKIQPGFTESSEATKRGSGGFGSTGL